MAYLNAAAGSGYTVLDQIATFAVAQGWTQIYKGSRPSGSGEWLVLRWGTDNKYVQLLALSHTVSINYSRTWNGSSENWVGQSDTFYSSGHNPGTAPRMYSPLGNGLSVHLFAGTTPKPYVYCAWELEPGYYRHLVFGYIDTFIDTHDAFFFDCGDVSESGGDYASFAEHSNYPMILNGTTSPFGTARGGGIDYYDRSLNPTYYSTIRDYGFEVPYRECGFNSIALRSFEYASPSEFNSRTALTPIEVFAYPGTAGIMPVGIVPNMRYIEIDHYAAGDEITLGQDIWKVFPVIRKGPDLRSGSYENPEHEFSENYGIAYLK